MATSLADMSFPRLSAYYREVVVEIADVPGEVRREWMKFVSQSGAEIGAQRDPRGARGVLDMRVEEELPVLLFLENSSMPAVLRVLRLPCR